MGKYVVTRSCYLRQDGQSEPTIVLAAPDRPVTVTLPDGTKPAPWMVPVDQAAQIKPLKPAHAETRTEVVPPAHEFAKRKGRAADE